MSSSDSSSGSSDEMSDMDFYRSYAGESNTWKFMETTPNNYGNLTLEIYDDCEIIGDGRTVDNKDTCYIDNYLYYLQMDYCHKIVFYVQDGMRGIAVIYDKDGEVHIGEMWKSLRVLHNMNIRDCYYLSDVDYETPVNNALVEDMKAMNGKIMGG